MDKAQIRKAFESAVKTDDIESFEDPILLRLTGLTWNEIRELKERDTAKAAEPAPVGYGMICPICGNLVQIWQKHCGECGQRLREDE